MPQRRIILATGETYHIFNRSLHQAPLFMDKREFTVFLAAMNYYRQLKPPIKFSLYRQQPHKYKVDFKEVLVKIIAYCLMPDHYHFILTQLEEGGIRAFIHRLTTSYSCYLNLRHKQKGAVFESRFKAIRVTTQKQLVHLSRYIHLNPVTSYLVEDPINYNYSSYKIYLKKEKSDFIDFSNVMDFFPQDYKQFVLNQKDYQRELKRIKCLISNDW